MLPLLEYSARKEQLLQEYYEALTRELQSREPWEDAHNRAILTGQLEALFQDTLQLYVNLIRLDEYHQYSAFTKSDYRYADVEEQLEQTFYRVHRLLVNELDTAKKFESEGYTLPSKHLLEKCLKEVNIILSGESPTYNTEEFQNILQQSFDDINAGRVEEMPLEP